MRAKKIVILIVAIGIIVLSFFIARTLVSNGYDSISELPSKDKKVNSESIENSESTESTESIGDMESSSSSNSDGISIDGHKEDDTEYKNTIPVMSESQFETLPEPLQRSYTDKEKTYDSIEQEELQQSYNLLSGEPFLSLISSATYEIKQTDNNTDVIIYTCSNGRKLYVECDRNYAQPISVNSKEKFSDEELKYLKSLGSLQSHVEENNDGTYTFIYE